MRCRLRVKRGLKLYIAVLIPSQIMMSLAREAWIEITVMSAAVSTAKMSLAREAWIEIRFITILNTFLYRCRLRVKRGLKSVLPATHVYFPGCRLRVKRGLKS